MSMPLRLTPDAKAEYDSSADFYEGRRKGLGLQFIARVREVFKRISNNPRIHQVVYADVRRAVVKQFPYVVIYREEADEVLVIAVFHTSRAPADWQSRV